jgi:hypothetical protein
MKNLIQAAVVTLFAASTAQAQQAVQWKVSDGGNGHWYRGIASPMTRSQATSLAAEQGGHLATITAAAENQFLADLSLPSQGGAISYWTGGIRASAGAGPWNWITGEAWSYSNFDTSEPNGCCGADVRFTTFRTYEGHEGRWDDTSPENVQFVLIEWSADCNNDGIVDFGQCNDGTLPDYNSNNIPDCCERGEACVVGNYPVQWRVEDGGNGHWYRVVVAVGDWEESRAHAMAIGSELCAITSAAENGHVLSLVTGAEQWCADGAGYWLGGFRKAGQWQWTSGEDFTYSYFGCGNPGDIQTSIQWYRVPTGCPPLGTIVWDDQFSTGCPVLGGNPGFVAEWDADCNNDGSVDYGQILQGQLADLDSNGVPDICQQPTCVAADLFRDFNVNGADLGILLSQWGPNTALTVSDINSDGVVNGADLGILLSFWGACP